MKTRQESEVERAKAVQPEAKRQQAPVAMSERSLRNLATKLGFKLTKLRKTGSYLVQRSDGMVVLGGDEYVGKYIRLEDVARFLARRGAPLARQGARARGALP